MSVRATLRRTWPVLLSYGLFSAWGLSCFVASLVISSEGLTTASPEAGGMLVGILVATAIGHVVGNVLGLAGLRLAPVVVVFGLLVTAAVIAVPALGPFALFLFVFVLAAVGGYLGIASRLDVVASWYPLSFAVGAAVFWMNTHGKAKTFVQGEKYAVWDWFSLLCLAGAVFLMLVFLATRQSLGLTVWQEVGRRRGGDAANVAVARPGRGSLLVLLLFTVAVLGATALVSPYLFRTHQGEKGDASSEGADGDDDGKDAAKKKGKGKRSGRGNRGHGEATQGEGEGGKEEGDGDGDGDGKPDPDGAKRAAAEAMAGALQLFAWILALVLLLLLLLLVLFPPLRRVFLIRHLEKPLWPVPPTSRVMNLWRRALAALAVVDIVPTPGESPRDFAARAEREVGRELGADAGALKDAAAVVEKIDYAGRGLGAEDEARMREIVTRLVQAVEPRTTWKKRLAAAWGRAPDVE